MDVLLGRVWETQLYHTVSGVLDEILSYTMCPNVLSYGTQDEALPLGQLKCLETLLNCIVTCIQSRINYFLVTINLTEWQRFILHPVLGIYHLPNRRYTYMYTVLRDSSIQSRIDSV